MEGILIYDERDVEKVHTIFAKEGFLVNNPETQEVVLRLLDGDLHRFEFKTNVYQKMKFDTYDLRIELEKTFAAWGARLKENEMSVDEIKEKIKKMKTFGLDTTSQEVELHKRYAIPFTCIVFGLIGVPLGIQPRRSGRSYGFILSIFIIMMYYISLTTSEILAMKKTLPPFFAGWTPNFLFFALGVYLLVKAANESPFKPLVWLNEGLDLIQRKWKGLFKDV
jgi:lipopolysaccharide export system permease protein